MEAIPRQLDDPVQPADSPSPALPTRGTLADCYTPAADAEVSTAHLVPATLERASFEYHLREYTRQFQPVGHIELMLVRDLARQTVAMEVWSEGLGALQRQRAQRLPEIVLPGGAEEGDLEDVALAAAISATDVHAGDRNAQKHCRAFYRALHTLQGLQGRRKQEEAGSPSGPPSGQFLTECDCEEYLRKRFEMGSYRCVRCGCGRGHYLRVRRCWECAQCKRQTGLRVGTVAADSPLPLVTWFTAIRLLLWQPTMGTTELGLRLGISRSTTVRSIAHRILGALAQENSSDLLAGLDVYGAQDQPALPESGAREAEKSATQSAGARSNLEFDATFDAAES